MTRQIVYFVTLIFGLVSLFPEACLAADRVKLDVESLIELASGVAPWLYGFVAIFIILMAVNVANIVLVWRVIPRSAAETAASHLALRHLDELQSLLRSDGGIFTRSLCVGIKRDTDGRPHLDVSVVMTSFHELTRRFFLSPRSLKAFGVMVLCTTMLGVGLESVRLYVELYERLAVVIGEYPFRKLFQLGCARIIVLGMGGVLVSVASLVSGYLFSGALRVILLRRTSSLLRLLSETESNSRDVVHSEDNV